MKNQNTLALHKTFEKGLGGKRTVVIYISNGKEADRLTPKELIKFTESIKPGQVIRLTAVNSADSQLIDFSKRGAILQYAYWHDLKIDKNLPPEEIVQLYANADVSLFREFVPNEKIAELRNALALRNAVAKFYGDAVRRFKQVGRNMGIAEGIDPLMEMAYDELGEVYSLFKGQKPNGKAVSLDKEVEYIAKQIPECILFNQVAGIQGSWITAASIVAYAGGIDRFPTVQHLWSYLGQSVIDGAAPKRKAGMTANWSAQGRTTVYLMGDSLIKNMKNPWRVYYDEVRATEVAVHADKHPDCPAFEGHCSARAKRKMCKEILKRFFLAAKGIKFNSDHPTDENHSKGVTVKAKKAAKAVKAGA